MEAQVGREMPSYKSHKTVWALKIAKIDHLPNPDNTGQSAAGSYGATITPADPGYGPQVMGMRITVVPWMRGILVLPRL